MSTERALFIFAQAVFAGFTIGLAIAVIRYAFKRG